VRQKENLGPMPEVDEPEEPAVPAAEPPATVPPDQEEVEADGG
jgi:hypothetical protein